MNDPFTVLEPIAGYLIDLRWRLQNLPYTPHSFTKIHNIITARNLSGAETAIEIGSFKGLTARRLSRFFKSVITVEIDAHLHSISKANCSGNANIEVIHGDGIRVMPQIANRVSKALIFLDGHFSGSGTGLGDQPEPVIQELELIKPHLDNFVAIVIDDFRLFGVEHGWPQKSEVFSQLERVLTDEWELFVLNDQIMAIKRSKPERQRA